MENSSKNNIVSFSTRYHGIVESSIEDLMYKVIETRKRRYFLLFNIYEYIENIISGRGEDIRYIDPFYWDILIYTSLNDGNMSVKICKELHDILENAYYVKDEEIYVELMSLISDLEIVYKNIYNGYKCDRSLLNKLYYRASYLNANLSAIKDLERNVNRK